MRGEYGIPSQLRNSYGFEHISINKGLQSKVTRPFQPGLQEAHKNIGSTIKNMQIKIEGLENISRNKVSNTNQDNVQSPTIRKQTNDQPIRENIIRLPQQMRGMDFRGSCPTNAIKYSNLRNTISINTYNPGIQKIQHFPEKKNFEKEMENTALIFSPSSKDKSMKTEVTNVSKIQPDSQKTIFTSLSEVIAKKDNKQLETQNRKNKEVGGFQIGRTLGKGKFGQVYLAKQALYYHQRHLETGFIVALKKIVKQNIKEYKMIDQLKNEIRLHSCLNHPNIVKFFGLIDQPTEIYLVMEYMNGGTLFDYLNQKDCLSAKQAADFLKDTIEAVSYLHERSIAHRDIKPQNIVLSSQGVAKLCDFGWSALVQNSRKTYCGTFDYAPPQILERKTYDASVDIWCLGVLTYQLLTGRVPFEGDKRNDVMKKIINVDKNKIDYPVQIPEDAKNFIESLVKKDPEQRPKCKDLLKHPFFVNNSTANQKSKKII